jgi:conjugal transfer/type IV secretion protein DotA/TraY
MVRRTFRLAPGFNASAPEPDSDFKRTVSNQLRADIEPEIAAAAALQGGSIAWQNQIAQVTNLGWGGAGIWYNKIAQLNGSLVTAVNSVPEIRSMPAVYEYTRARALSQNLEAGGLPDLGLAGNIEMQFQSELEGEIARTISYVIEYWKREPLDQGADGAQAQPTANVFIDAINAIFGTRGLFNMCANTDTHPLAQLSILGKGLVEASIRNLMLAVGFGALSTVPIPFIGAASGAAASILTSIATMTITMGFLLFYVVPFMPFLYFFFAVGAWVKGIFEAMVGVPLWALAHLRIDGEGLPGDAAMDGYYLIFEIFLRPILIVFGLLASVIIFSAMVRVLNEIYSLVVFNLAGHDGTRVSGCTVVGGPTLTTENIVRFFRGPIDEFFFTVIYAIIVYMIGMSCFKLIDLIPNNILRFMNVNVQTYNDALQDPADGLMIKLSLGMNTAMGPIGRIGQGAAGVAEGLARVPGEIAAPPTRPSGPQ